MDPEIRRIRMLRKSWFRAVYLAARGQELRRQGRDQSREPQRGHFATLGGRNLQNISVPQLSRCRAEKIKSKRNVAFVLRHSFVIRHSCFVIPCSGGLRPPTRPLSQRCTREQKRSRADCNDQGL